ncbi:MAG: permease [Melioribacteraceae bacterium]|nr:permease [Melioribacteraceae bacterium]MCF8354092.1 permease [Melioribacteraceae bacterium]MCF8393764.1 permease [Melioribacteraceae bacterium]MCF8419508.1 permease [Melioribacteraceae bacterium]
MDWKEQYKSFLWILGFFLFAYFMPIEDESFSAAIIAAFDLAKWYAQEHVLLCLIPAFFIAGVIAVFVSQNAVIKYLGGKAKKWVAYSVASVSGTILAVCSCTVLPLFSGIHKRGAGLGPAIAFLYSGPAINILAIILTARILGFELGVARVIGAVTFSIVIGLIMSFIYRKEEKERAAAQLALPEPGEIRPIWQTAFHFFVLVAILVFANWGSPDTSEGFWYFMFDYKWLFVGIFGILFSLSLAFILKLNKLYVFIGSAIVLVTAIIWGSQPLIPFTSAVIILTLLLTFSKGEPNEWLGETWGFTKQIMPLLAAGVLVAGFLLGSADNGNGIIPNEWITNLVGGNSLFSNFFASIVGAFMYFATLTEIPILQGLINSGMGKGPALALLLAGPALSLPNMLVIRSVIGTKKTAVFVSLVVIMSTIVGMIYGGLF